MLKEKMKIVGSVIVAEDIQKKVKAVGVRGLDFEKAKELGVFTRMGNTLSVAHTTILAAYRIYSDVDYLMDLIQGRKNEIARAMNAYEKAFDKFFSFWTMYYANGSNAKEINHEMENLYHRIMEWAQLPEAWELGDHQRTNENDIDIAIKIESKEDNRLYTFRSVSLNRTVIESNESWCVLCYNTRTDEQTTVYVNMDKASAMMSAKRLSAEDSECIYTAAIVHDITEKRTEVTPFKAFRNNETVGKIMEVDKDGKH